MEGYTNAIGDDEDVAQGSLEPGLVGQEGWTWEMIEKERQRGMKIAEHMLGMDELKEEFTGNSKPALGIYRDFLWP